MGGESEIVKDFLVATLPNHPKHCKEYRMLQATRPAGELRREMFARPIETWVRVGELHGKEIDVIGAKAT